MSGEIKGRDLPKGDNNEGDVPAAKAKGGSKGDVVSGDSAQELNKEVFKNSGALAKAQMSEKRMLPEFYAASLPVAIKRRLKALKSLQVKVNLEEAGFYEELHKLECKYHSIYQGLYDKRSDIVNGKVEPTDEECQWPEDEFDPLCDKFMGLTMHKEQVKAFADTHKIDESAEGIPDFWVTVFKNSELIKSNVEPHDWPILKHLQDIKLSLNEDTLSFKLDFEFEDNEFFANKVLSKTYFLKIKVDEESPLLYEGPEVYKCEGTEIQWKTGKDVTVRLVKKVQKHKCRGTKRVLTKTVPNDSFFNFFKPPSVKEGEEVDEETEIILESDFEIGQFFRERVIPRAVLFFTGENIEDEYEDDQYEGEDEEEDDDDDDKDEDLDEN